MGKVLLTAIRVAALLLMVSAIITGVLHFLAYIRLGNAYWGFLGAFLGVSISWIVCFLPAMLWYSLFKNLPVAWYGSISLFRRFIGVLLVIVLLGGAAELVAWGNGWLIGWIANLDCVRALEAGVTGSNPCH